MSSPGAAVRGGLLATALARAEAWLLEPADPADQQEAPPLAGARPVVAVFGLARGCGATVVARALGTELAARDAAGTAAVTAPCRGSAIPLASSAAARLARTLADLPGARTRASGRLCLVEGADPLALSTTARHHAPLVLDAGDGPVGGVPASVSDRVVLVASPRVEPALAEAAAACLSRVAPDPLLVLNRAREGERWSARPAVVLPESRLGAQLAASGREPRGELGRAVAALAEQCEVPA